MGRTPTARTDPRASMHPVANGVATLGLACVNACVHKCPCVCVVRACACVRVRACTRACVLCVVRCVCACVCFCLTTHQPLQRLATQPHALLGRSSSAVVDGHIPGERARDKQTCGLISRRRRSSVVPKVTAHESGSADGSGASAITTATLRVTRVLRRVQTTPRELYTCDPDTRPSIRRKACVLHVYQPK
jgi:hypothetical protein